MTPDQTAAHQFLAELRTRISTQPLPYQYGVEIRALESMREVFGYAREAIKGNPGCKEFANRTTTILNTVIRPFTAKWHRALEQGRLHGLDGADEFRGELQALQEKLRTFASELHEMAYGFCHQDELTPEVMAIKDVEKLFSPLPFGFTAHREELESAAQLIRDKEAEAVQARRRARQEKLKNANPVSAQEVPSEPQSAPSESALADPSEGYDAIGFALSGGGIRSATFSLGVVQVLAQKGLLAEVDFLSTVSGGGYTGCFLTQRLGDGESQNTVASPHGQDPEAVSYVRQRARYLDGDNLWAKWLMVSASFGGMLLNWSAPLFVIALLALAATISGTPPPQFFGGAFRMLLVPCFLTWIVYGWGMRKNRSTYRNTAGAFGILLALTLLVGAASLFDPLLSRLVNNVPNYLLVAGGWGESFSALFASLLATPLIIRFIPVFEKPRIRKLALKVALALAGFLLPIGGLVLFYSLREIGNGGWGIKVLGQSVTMFGRLEVGYGTILLAGITAILGFIAVFVININLTGPHRLYRDCLARTFIQKTPNGSPEVKLSAINPQGTAPYHIINAALNVPSSESLALRGRGCDFFMFSKEWIGSPSTGYFPTSQWKANGQEVDLATAMAASGAAFSSHMGLESKATLCGLLTFFNIRLGFWIKKPFLDGTAQSGCWRLLPKVASRVTFGAEPGFWCLLREMTGICMSEDKNWLNLSDGGHIENLAVYELLRRRCKLIICVDGEADPTFTFQGLMTVVRHAQIDLGIEIKPGLNNIRPDPETSLSRTHFHLCRIHYSSDEVGLLLYMKLSVTGDESELINRYRINNPEFPHQTTLDQFFDQEQFEAYRQLGVHVAEALFKPALMNGSAPKSVSQWFRLLAANLLEPLPC